MREITDSLAGAFDRIDDFQAVQSGAGAGELRQVVDLLQESVGIGEVERSMLLDRLEGIRGSSLAAAHVLLGLIVGLMASEDA